MLEKAIIPRLNILTLNEGTAALGKLQDLYRETNRTNDSVQRLKIKKLMDAIHPIVEQMNNSSKVVTARDLQMIGSFFSPPLEQYYVDPCSKMVYHVQIIVNFLN